MSTLRLREPPDCEHCEAPCCHGLRLADAATGRLQTWAEARKPWLAAGADLIELLPRQFDCTAFKGGHCTVYQARPQACRDYDCRDHRQTIGAHCRIHAA